MSIFDSLFGEDIAELGRLKVVSDAIASQCWVIFSSFLESGFSREESLELTKFVVKIAGKIGSEKGNKNG